MCRYMFPENQNIFQIHVYWDWNESAVARQPNWKSRTAFSLWMWLWPKCPTMSYIYKHLLEHDVLLMFTSSDLPMNFLE